MAGDKRALVKAARKIGLRQGKNGEGDALTLLDAAGREVFRGAVDSTASLQRAVRELRRRGFTIG